MSESHGRTVEIDSVRHYFKVGRGLRQALDRIDLSVESGEFVCLAGPSGCGKTTLLRLLAGFMHPTEGVVRVEGERVTKPGEERGVVFQAPNLFPWLSVKKNVELGPKLRGVSKAERAQQADHFLDMVGLADFHDHKPYELSGGMQQRCQIARVLTNDPDIVLMDEPFGALDAITRERLQEELLDIWRQTGKTILFITHSVDEAVFLSTRVMVMSPRPGRIVLDRDARFSGSGSGSGSGDKVAADEIRALPEYTALLDEVRSAIHTTPGEGGAVA